MCFPPKAAGSLARSFAWRTGTPTEETARVLAELSFDAGQKLKGQDWHRRFPNRIAYVRRAVESANADTNPATAGLADAFDRIMDHANPAWKTSQLKRWAQRVANQSMIG